MMSNPWFYHRLTRKYITLFGNVFNNITLMRINRDNDTEIERIKVPIIWAPKEKYFVRAESDPDFNRSVQSKLPRMEYSITGFSWDIGRQQNKMQRQARANTVSGVAATYIGVPYDIDFELQILTRNTDDGFQIVEQIMPYLVPDITITVDILPEIGFRKDIPITLMGISNEITHEGSYDAIKFSTWTLSFRMKAYYYGPITQPKIIRQVTTNINAMEDLMAGYITRMNLDEGNSGTFKLEDIAFQGDTYETASAYGHVLAWSNTRGHIVLGGVQGQFKTNNTIRAVSSNATYNIASFDATPMTYATITIEPDPINALPNSDYGYTTTITEWPETES